MNYLDIDAFFPFYNEEKNTHTCVLYHDGTQKYVKPNVAKYILQLYFEAMLNYEAIHNWSCDVLHAKCNLPLLFNKQCIFIPIKFRQPPYMPSPSYTYGYVHFNAIAFFSEHEVILKNQIVLQTISPTSFIEKKIRDAIFLGYVYEKKLGLPH